jgi:sugar O-acyltransferase (sialic acid O-acetyltransferase NeuD family)
MAEKLIVVGGGGFGSEVYWLAEEAGWDVLGFLDDNAITSNTGLLDQPILGPITDWVKFEGTKFVVGIGAPRTRQRVVEAMCQLGVPQFATLIHPSVHRSRFVEIGEGTMVTAGCILTTNISIGRHNILNLNVTVGHDCRFSDFVTVAPMAAISGRVTIRERVEVGTGAAIRQGLEVGQGSVVGMGAVVTRDLGPQGIYVGNPARLLKSLSD